jgi:hypothetical protein
MPESSAPAPVLTAEAAPPADNPPLTVGRLADLHARLQRSEAGWTVLLTQGVYRRGQEPRRVLPVTEDLRPRLAPDSWVVLYDGPDHEHALRLQRHVASVLRQVIRSTISMWRHGRLADDWDPKLAATCKHIAVLSALDSAPDVAPAAAAGE